MMRTDKSLIAALPFARAFLFGAALLVLGLQAQPTVAQQSVPFHKADPIDALTFKVRMVQLVDRLDGLAATTQGGELFRGSLKDARALLDEMRLEDFAYVSPVLEQEIVALEQSLVDISRVRDQNAGPALVTKTAGLPSAPYPDTPWGFEVESSADTPGDGSESESESGACTLASAPTAAEAFQLLNLGFVTDALADTAKRLCDYIIVVVGAGANVALLCIVTEILRSVVNGIKDHEILCANIVTAAEVTGNYERIGHVHGDLETAKINLTTEIDVNETKLIDLDADLVAHDANLEARADAIDQSLGAQQQFLERFRELMLRLDIEMHLAETSTGAISAFRLPSGMEGYLETVAEVVESAIASMIAAGEKVGRAQKWFDSGEAAAGAGDWTAALTFYGRAYGEVVK